MKAKYLLLLVLLVAVQFQAAAAVRYVKNTSSGTGAGNSWANASNDLQLMIDQSGTNDEIWVATGFYKPARLYTNTSVISLNDRNNSFVMKANVNIYGGFSGNETLLSARNWQSNQTYLDGDIGITNDSSDNCYSVVRCTSAIGTAVIDGFYIRNGNGSGLTPSSNAQSGSGLFIFQGSPTVENCIFMNNISTDGGAIYIQNGSPTINNCQFYNNTALGEGGAINGYIPGAYTVNRCWFANNKALNGGAIANQYSQISQVLLVKNSIFQGNYASGTGYSGGGAIYNYDNIYAEYINCTFAGNRAASYGGAIFTMSNGGGDVLKNCIVWGNTAVTSGMNLLDTFGAAASITHSIIEGGFTGTGNNANDPAFINPRPASWAPTVSGDYKILPCSPAIDAGNNTYLTANDNKDFHGNTRIQNVNVDMGAFEITYQPVSPDPNGRVYVNKNIFIQGSGSSWGNAHRELADALKAALYDTSIHEIWVAAGTYYPLYDGSTLCATPIGGSPRDKAFTIAPGLKLYGGFAGTETSISQRDWNTNAAILSGDLGNLLDTTDNAKHIISLGYLLGANNSLIDGFTVKDGNAGAGAGAAIYSFQANIDIRNCTFTNHVSAGGALYLWYGQGTIENCHFSNNHAYNNGVISFMNSSYFKVNNSTFTGNTSSTSVIYNHSSYVEFRQCIFSGNKAFLPYFTGPSFAVIEGAINSHSEFTNCTWSGNQINFGSIFSSANNSSVKVRNSIIWNNTFGQSSLSLTQANSTDTFTNCIVQGPVTGSANINANPLFINAPLASAAPFTNGDYRLQKCSPAVNTGNNNFLTANDTVDLVYNKRVRENTVDLGAYELSFAKANPNGIVYVDSSTINGGEGDSWTSAVSELADAMRAAKYDTAIHEIWVAKGSYKPLYSADSMHCNPVNPRDKAFVMAEGLKLYGGFAGNEISLSQQDAATNKTVMSGDIGVTNTMNDNCYHVLVASNIVGNNHVVDGFTITKGYNSATFGNDTISVNGYRVFRNMGAGISISTATLDIRNCIIAGNHASYGGGIALYGHGTYRFNGMQYQDAAAVTSLTNCIISGNVADNTVYPGGAGIYRFSSWATMNIINTTITGNRADFKGGSFAQVVPHPGSMTNINNSILWLNNGVSGDKNFDTTANNTITVNNSIVEGGYNYGTNVSDQHPLFISGINPINAPSTSGDFHLAPCSPAINMGNNNLISGVSKDIAGSVRVQQSTIDMGAYENTAPTVSIVPGDSITSTNYNYACGQTPANYIPKYTWTNIYGANFNNLILAIQDTNQVMFGSFPIYTHSKVSNNYGTGNIQQLNNPFGQTGHYYPINRTWSVTATSPLTAPVNLRFYISENDSIQLAALNNFGSLQNLIVYKVNGTNPYATSATGYKEYTYAASADTSHFTIGTHQGVRYVEFWVTGFSSGALALKTTSPLNVTLGDITAQNFGLKNRVDWNTLSEEKTDYIILERSRDGREFKELRSITAQGKPSSYSYWDENPVAGLNYYRLKINGANGGYIYSRVVSAFVNTKNAFAMEVFPNPTVSKLNVSIYGGIKENAAINMTDITGKKLTTVQVTTSKLEFDITRLEPGIYLLKYADDERQQMIKFQKI